MFRVRKFLLCLLVLFTSPFALADELKTVQSIEYNYSESADVPKFGWERATIPFHDFFLAVSAEKSVQRTLWIRFELSADPNGNNLHSIFVDYVPERYTAFLNGHPIHRNYADPGEHTFGSFAPAEIALPDDLVLEGQNSVALRLESELPGTLGIGRVRYGSAAEIRQVYEQAYFWQFTGPQIINGIIAVLTIFVFLFWLWRPQEENFFWLALLGVIWWVRNLHYSEVDPAIGPQLMWEIAVNSLFLIMFAFFGFAASFFRVEQRARLIWVSGAFTVFMIMLRWALVTSGKSDLPAYLPMIPFALALAVIFVRACLRKPSPESFFMLGAVTVAIGFSFHDFAFLGNLWRGAGFQLQPYASLIVYSAFFFAVGRRVLTAFATVENLNALLETRVDEATRRLRLAEDQRRVLEVSAALDHERERMMQEMHDRIGTGLISAIAASEARGDSQEALHVLRNSLFELRITVDSLEPFEGNVGLLLAGFRHRIERDLNDAGVRFDWHVERVPDLVWLDAPNGLHVLRTLQEAFANILLHAKARTVRVGCEAGALDGVPGVRITISDDGAGFDVSTVSHGRGLANMAARIGALQGRLSVQSQPSGGTDLGIWLPVEKPI